MKSWQCSVYCNGRTSKLNKTASYDICPLMDEYMVDMNDMVHNRSAFQFDQNLFKGANKETHQAVRCYMKTVCREAGFEVYQDHHRSHSKPRGRSLATMVFVCRHGQLNKKVKLGPMIPTPHEEGRRVHATTFHANTVEEKCPFFVRMFCDSNDTLWYLGFNRLRQNLIGVEDRPPKPCLHCNHLRMDTSVLRVSMQEIRHHCKDLLLMCGKANVTDQVKANLMKVCGKFGGGNIKYAQMSYFQACHDDLSNVVAQIDGSMSSAEKILALMDALIANGDDLDYCALIHSHEQEYKVRFPKGRPPKSITDGSTDRKTTIAEIRKSMKVSEGTEVLLAIAWISGEEKELFRRFPTVVSADITEKLNKEKRPTFIFVGLDGNNKLFPCFRCFLPNSSLEMFNWAYERAFVLMMGEEQVKLNKVFLTDGEFNMYYAMDLVTDTHGPWKNTKTFRCRFHLLYQPWKKTVGGKPKKGSMEETLCQWVLSYIEYMMYNVIYEYQLDICIERFQLELQSHSCLFPSTRIAIDKIWCSMKCCRKKWARCYRNDLMDLEQGSTSSSESFNSTLKRTCGKKRLAASDLGSSARMLITHSRTLLERREE